MTRLYFEDSTREELLACKQFKFHDSAVFFAWDDGHYALYMHDLDGSFNHLRDGNFEALEELGIDVAALNEKLKGVELRDWLDNHYTVLGD